MLDFRPELEIETESVAQLGFRLKSGILAQVHLDYLRPCYGRSTEIVGERGVVTWDYTNGTVTLERRGAPPRVVHKVPEGFQRNDMYVSEAKHFLDSIAGKNAGLAANLKAAEHALRVAFAAHISSEQRRFVAPDEVDDDWCRTDGDC
jgi:predicted dehydrogenase